MGESAQHCTLVHEIYKYVIARVPEGEEVLVLVDSPSSVEKPSLNRDGYRPDVEYYRRELLIIGDAKTSDDLETQHSLKQIKSYITECHDFGGKALLVIGVPFTESTRACSVIGVMQHKLGTTVPYTIINEAGVFIER